MRRGLVFGKFMPPHRGHQLMIETAQAQVDGLTILIYDSQPQGEYPHMPVEKRLGWMRMLYPDVENILAVEDPVKTRDHDDPRYAQLYADQLRFLGPFDRVFTNEPYYEDFAVALGAQHVLVDEGVRTLVPISATQIRSNLYDYRGWIDPRVYASLIQKVVFVGTESTGKSTLARAMAERFETLWTHEYGRELWEAQGLTGSFADHLKTARAQRRREEAAARQARSFVFCDTNAWTTLHWSLRSFGTADARLYELVEQTQDDYLWVLCDNDFGWVQDGTRELVDGEAARFQQQQIDDLGERGIQYAVASGSVETRVEVLAHYLTHAYLSPTLR